MFIIARKTTFLMFTGSTVILYRGPANICTEGRNSNKYRELPRKS